MGARLHDRRALRVDRSLFWSVLDIERKLGEFQPYFNNACVYVSLGAIPIALG